MPAVKKIRGKVGWHRVGKKMAHCGTCRFHVLDKHWQKIGATFEIRNVCTNTKSLLFERHTMVKEACNKHEKRSG
jgi:hypothetical protein